VQGEQGLDVGEGVGEKIAGVLGVEMQRLAGQGDLEGAPRLGVGLGAERTLRGFGDKRQQAVEIGRGDFGQINPGKEAGFFNQYPFYTEVTIPANTYSGVDHDTLSFQDSALWVAGKHVKKDIVTKALEDIYSKEGLAYMIKVKSTAKAMSIQGGLDGVVTPVHPGAIAFWEGKGLTIKPEQK